VHIGQGVKTSSCHPGDLGFSSSYLLDFQMQNALVSLASTSTLTMSSREIAEHTGKHHHHVLADIRTMLEQLEIAATEFRLGYLDANGQERTMFNLPKDLTITLVSGYSAPMRFAIVKRWMELEAQAPAATRVPTNFREALLLAAAQQEQLEEAQAQFLSEAT
jgi:phage regulator Rha-like protein